MRAGCFDRAAVLAPANDLTRRDGGRRTRDSSQRVVPSPGCSAARSASPGSGPTCWVLYPSLADAAAAAAAVADALATGELRLPGGGRPFVHATTIASAGDRRRPGPRNGARGRRER